MPTGYTDCIKDGISFKDFVLQCARAMCPCIMQRDDLLSPQLKMDEPSDWNLKNLEKVQKDLEHFQNSSNDDLMVEFISSINDRVKEYVDCLEEKSLLLIKYQEMLYQVQSWVPPTEEHRGLKKFMIEQIEESIKWDCDMTYFTNCINQLRCLSFDDWKKERIESIERNILYYIKNNKEETGRCNERNLWKKQLIESLQCVKN